MHKKFFIVTAILLAVAAGLTASVSAQGKGRGFGHRPGWMLQRMTKSLNLTDAQQTQMKSIMTHSRPSTTPRMQQPRQSRQAENANRHTAVTGGFDEVKARSV